METHRVLVKLPKHSLPVRGTSSRLSLTAALLTLYYFPSVGSKACPLTFGSSSLPETEGEKLITTSTQVAAAGVLAGSW